MYIKNIEMRFRKEKEGEKVLDIFYPHNFSQHNDKHKAVCQICKSKIEDNGKIRTFFIGPITANVCTHCISSPEYKVCKFVDDLYTLQWYKNKGYLLEIKLV